MFDGGRTGVYGSSDDPSQGVPCSIVKPVMEAIETLRCQVLGGPEVEVRIELVNDALESQDGKQPRGEGCRETGVGYWATTGG